MALLIPLIALALASLFDYVSFLVMVSRHGLAAEANPLVRGLVEQLGLPGLTLAKLATVLMAGAAVALLFQRRRGVALALVVFGVLAGVVGGLSNVATI
jgi:hypothetical protein